MLASNHAKRRHNFSKSSQDSSPNGRSCNRVSTGGLTCERGGVSSQEGIEVFEYMLILMSISKVQGRYCF